MPASVEHRQRMLKHLEGQVVATKQIQFDDACAAFTLTMGHVMNWKQTYYGAAYTTRLRQAIKDARTACDRMERVLDFESQAAD